MIINIFEEKIEIENTSTNGKAVLQQILDLLFEKNLALDHLLIDGENIPNEHEKYIDEHLNDIQNIEVFTTDIITLAMDNVDYVRDTLNQYIPVMDTMAADFRLGVSKRGWDEFEAMMNDLLYLDKATKAIFNMFIDTQITKLTSAWDRIREEYIKLYKPVKAIEEALFADDPVKAGDLIQNEIKPICTKVVELIGEMRNKFN